MSEHIGEGLRAILPTNDVAVSISSSFRTLAFKLPHKSPTSPHLIKTLFPSSSSSPFPLFKPITFQTLPTTTPTPTPTPKPLPPSSSSSPSPSLQPISDLSPPLQEIITLFQGVADPKSKYEQLLFYGRNLPPLDAQFKTPSNKVHGCVSQVWVRAYLDPQINNNVFFEADSDSVLTKGLAALLVKGLSGRPVTEIIRVTPDFVTLLGLQQSLTPSRNNGFLNMLKLMQKKALLLAVQEEGQNTTTEGEEEESDVVIESESESLDVDSGSGEGEVAVVNGGASGGRAERIRERLESELSPLELEVEDVSYQHAGHAGNRAGEDGTHINLRIVSKEFEGKSVVKRHRMIYGLLKEELESGLHALSIVAKAPGEAV